jgi:hypothetical protein
MIGAEGGAVSRGAGPPVLGLKDLLKATVPVSTFIELYDICTNSSATFVPHDISKRTAQSNRPVSDPRHDKQGNGHSPGTLGARRPTAQAQAQAAPRRCTCHSFTKHHHGRPLRNGWIGGGGGRWAARKFADVEPSHHFVIFVCDNVTVPTVPTEFVKFSPDGCDFTR